MQLKSFHSDYRTWVVFFFPLYPWNFHITLPDTCAWITGAHRLFLFWKNEWSYAQPGLLLFPQRLTSANSWSGSKGDALLASCGSPFSPSLKLSLTAQFIWLAWWHPARFMLCSCTASIFFFTHRPTCNSTRSGMCRAQPNFIMSVLIPLIFPNMVMTLLWKENRGVISGGKGQMRAIVVQRCSMHGREKKKKYDSF